MSEDQLGPIEYAIVEFSDTMTVRAGLDRLLELVDAGLIQVLDMEFVMSSAGARAVAPTYIGAELADFAGACSGLLDQDDLDSVAAGLAADSSAVVLIYEELTIRRVFRAWENAGARIIAEGPVDLADLDAALNRS